MNVKHIAFLREMSALVKGITLNNNLYKIKDDDEISDADSDEEKFSGHQGASEQSNEESN